MCVFIIGIKKKYIFSWYKQPILAGTFLYTAMPGTQEYRLPEFLRLRLSMVMKFLISDVSSRTINRTTS
jgi:hypothetical protein